MEVLKLILHIISSLIMLFFGVGMIAVGVYDIKKCTPPKCLSAIAIADGIFTIVLIFISWFW